MSYQRASTFRSPIKGSRYHEALTWIFRKRCLAHLLLRENDDHADRKIGRLAQGVNGDGISPRRIIRGWILAGEEGSPVRELNSPLQSCLVSVTVSTFYASRLSTVDCRERMKASKRRPSLSS